MQIKRFTQFIQESFSREEEAQLRNMGLAPTRWYVALTIEISWAANTTPEQIREDFKDWIERDFSIGAWRIDSESIELDEWEPEAFDFEENMEFGPSVSFTLITQTGDEALVEAWLNANLIGRVFDDINDLQKIEAEA
jgi:hypothetical protein